MYEQPFNPFAKNLAIVKDYFKSSSVLIFAILKTVAIALTIPMAILSAVVSPFMITVAQNNTNQALAGASPEDAQFVRDFLEPFWQLAQSAVGTASPVQAVVNNLPSLVVPALVAVALFLIYFKSKNTDPASKPTAGVVILYVLAVIQVVMVWITLVSVVLVIIFLFWLFAAMKDVTGTISSIEAPMFLSDPVELPFAIDGAALRVIVLVAAITLTVVTVIGGFIALFTTINQKRYYRSIKQSISSVELQSKGARPYGVMCVIAAVFSGLGLTDLLPNFVALFKVPANGTYIAFVIISSLAQIAAFVALIFEAKIALGYKKYIDDKKYGYSQPVAPSAPYSPFPYGQGSSAPQNPYADPVRQDPTNPYADAYTSAPANKSTSVCPRCGADIDPAAPFCGNCGNKL